MVVFINLYYNYNTSNFNGDGEIFSLITSIITFFSVLIIIFQLNLEFIKRKKEQFKRLFAILYELQLIIIRCEGYLKKWKEGDKHYNKIKKHDFHTQISQAQIADIDSKVYNSILKMYYVSEVIIDNLEKSEVVNKITGNINSKNINNVKINWFGNPILIKNIKKGEISLSDIDSNRYSIAISFIKWYLEDMYRNFNIIFKNTKNYAKLHDFQFPDDLKSYNIDYVSSQIKKFQLELGKIHSH